MALMDFIKKQFIDILEWTEEGNNTLAWRYPMEGMEIQNGAALVVRASQMAVFVNEGQVADVFGPGTYKLTTQTLPVLTYLKNWDKLFQSPFKSDVYFFSTRQQIDQKWGTPQPITIRDADFGAVRLRAFGNYAYRIADPKLFHTEISGTRADYGVAELDGQLRGLVLQNISNAIAGSAIPFLDLAANQQAFATALVTTLQPEFAKLGLQLENLTVQNLSLPEELQKIMDQKIGMGMVGNDMGKFMQYQTAQAIPKFAEGSGSGDGGIAGSAMGLGAGVALKRCFLCLWYLLCRLLKTTSLPPSFLPSFPPPPKRYLTLNLQRRLSFFSLPASGSLWYHRCFVSIHGYKALNHDQPT